MPGLIEHHDDLTGAVQQVSLSLSWTPLMCAILPPSRIKATVFCNKAYRGDRLWMF
jgi:hypothetical protein